MKKLLGIATLLMAVLSLTSCGLADMIGPSVADKIECPGLDGAYKTNADLLFNFIPLNQSYNVNIASGAKDVIVQIESVDEDEEKNMICTIFSDVEVYGESNLNLLKQSGTTSMVADTNVEKFVNKLSSLRFKKSEESCVAKELFARKLDSKLDSMKSSRIVLTPDVEVSAKSFGSIKRECGRLVLVEKEDVVVEEEVATTEDVAEEAAEEASVEEAPAAEAPAVEEAPAS